MATIAIKGFFYGIAHRIALGLAHTPLSPNSLTFAGLALNTGVAALILSGNFLIGGILTLVVGAFDMLDGALARATQRTSAFGAFLDSTLDRYADAVLLIALVPWAQSQEGPELYLIFASLVGSFLVSYVRARAEGLGLECKVGLLSREWRLAVFAIGLILGLVTAMLWVLTSLSNFTALQRIWHVWNETRRADQDAPKS